MKKIYVLLVSFLLIFSLFTSTFATDDIQTIKDGMKEANGFDPTLTASNDEGIGKAINDIIGLLQIAGTGIALITVTILGAKYMMASPDERANTKNRFLPVLIGSVILFSAVNLVALIADIVQQTLN